MNAKWKPYLQRQKVSLKVWRLRRTRVYFFFDMCKIKCIPGLLHRLPRADQDRMRRLTAPSPAYPQGLREGQGRATQQPILKEPVPWGPQAHPLRFCPCSHFWLASLPPPLSEVIPSQAGARHQCLNVFVILSLNKVELESEHPIPPSRRKAGDSGVGGHTGGHPWCLGSSTSHRTWLGIRVSVRSYEASTACVTARMCALWLQGTRGTC